MSGEKSYHAHPMTILANLWRVFYLTIIPVVRGFLTALQGGFALWVQGAWIDILIFLFMIAIAVLRWHAVTYTYNDREIVLNLGWLLTRQIRVTWHNVTTVSMVETFYLRPFRAAWLRADTLGGSAGKPDFSILLHRDQARALIGRQRDLSEQLHPREYIPRTGSVLALALLTSNSLGGILFIATFVSQSGRLLGNEFSDLIIGTFEEVARILAFGIPPAAAAIADILLAGWFIGFLLTFVRYKNFAVSRSRSALNIGGGIFTNRQYCINFADINFIDIRQSISTKALKLYSLYISAVGYGKQKDDMSCIIPTENRRIFTLNRERLFPSFSPSRRQVAPKPTGIMRFIGVGLALCAAIPLAMVILIWIFPSWQGFILFVGLMSMVPALFFLTVRVMDFATCGFSKSGKYYTLRYSKGFYLHTVVIPENKIVCIELRQSPLQRFTPNCDLIISTRAETHFYHRCRNLNKAKLEQILKM